MMSTIHAQGRLRPVHQGRAGRGAARCTCYMENGKPQPMTEAKRAEIWPRNKAMADKALRVLAAAQMTTLPGAGRSPPTSSRSCASSAWPGMIDPVRPEVKAAVAGVPGAGIRPVMITGDHKDTAVAIAKELGIIDRRRTRPSPARSWTGLSDEELDEEIEHFGVYARVQPEHKMRIVHAWRRGAMSPP